MSEPSTSNSNEDERSKRLQLLRLRLQKSSNDNRAALHEEYNTSKNQVRVAQKQEKQEKLSEVLQEKRRAIDEGEDVGRSKNLDYSIEDNEKWEKKLKQKARNGKADFDGNI